MTAKHQQKKIVSYGTCQALVAMIEMGKARVIKEYSEEGPVYTVFSASMSPIGIISEKYRFMFEKMLSERGSGDGLFDGFSQTTRP